MLTYPLVDFEESFEIGTMASVLLFIFAVFSITKGQNYYHNCGLAKSCGACLKTHPSCSWCTDQYYNGERCDMNENLQRTCNRQSIIHQSPPNLEIVENRPLGDPHNHYANEIHQLKPQQLQFQMKPEKGRRCRPRNRKRCYSAGRFVDIFKRLYRQSAYESETEEPGKSCYGLQLYETIIFNVSVTLNDCVTDDDVIISYLGVSGVPDVVTLSILPRCGCECEKLEKQLADSVYCSNFGSMICGACVCRSGRSGHRCERECDPDDKTCLQEEFEQELTSTLATTTVTSSCSTVGCQVRNGQLCGGNGFCDCGVCRCYPEWKGVACDCTTLVDSCIAPDLTLCNNEGTCECGRCLCFDKLQQTQYCETNNHDGRKPEETGGEAWNRPDKTGQLNRGDRERLTDGRPNGSESHPSYPDARKDSQNTQGHDYRDPKDSFEPMDDASPTLAPKVQPRPAPVPEEAPRFEPDIPAEQIPLASEKPKQSTELSKSQSKQSSDADKTKKGTAEIVAQNRAFGEMNKDVTTTRTSASNIVNIKCRLIVSSLILIAIFQQRFAR